MQFQLFGMEKVGEAGIRATIVTEWEHSPALHALR